MTIHNIESMIEDDHVFDGQEGDQVLILTLPRVENSSELDCFYRALLRTSFFLHRPDFVEATEISLSLFEKNQHFSLLFFMMSEFTDPTEIMFRLIKSESYARFLGTKMAKKENLHSLRGNTLLRLYESMTLTFEEYQEVFGANDSEDVRKVNFKNEDVDWSEIKVKFVRIFNWFAYKSFEAQYLVEYPQKIREKKKIDFVDDFNENVKKYSKDVFPGQNIDNGQINIDRTAMQGLYYRFSNIRRQLLIDSLESHSNTNMQNTQKSIKQKLACFYLETGDLQKARQSDKQIAKKLEEINEKEDGSELKNELKYTEWGKWLLWQQEKQNTGEYDLL